MAEKNKRTSKFLEQNRLYKRIEILIHIVAWCILLGIPFFFTGRSTQYITLDNYIRFLIVPLSFMFIFYANYRFLISQFLFTKRTSEFLLINLLFIILTIIFVHLLMQLLPDPRPPHRPGPPDFEIIKFFLGNAMLYMLVAGLSVAIKMTENWYQMESMRREVEQSRIEAELMNLKSQLNPHFLFNTLNNIYALIAFDSVKAQEAVHDLSRLLRYVLYDSNAPFVTMSREMDFIQNYVDLMKIRMPLSAHVNMELSVDSNLQIAPLLFISLIENAFKHGISNREPSYISIRIKSDEKGVDCYIENSYFPKDEQDKSGSGIGLTNLQKRLELIYPGKYLFFYERKDDIYITNLYLNIKSDKDEADMCNN